MLCVQSSSCVALRSELVARRSELVVLTVHTNKAPYHASRSAVAGPRRPGGSGCGQIGVSVVIVVAANARPTPHRVSSAAPGRSCQRAMPTPTPKPVINSRTTSHVTARAPRSPIVVTSPDATSASPAGSATTSRNARNARLILDERSKFGTTRLRQRRDRFSVMAEAPFAEKKCGKRER